MASGNEPENINVDPIWTTWRYGHDVAIGAAALMAESMANGIEAEPAAERGDPVNVLRSFASILRMGKYSDKERAHAMMPIDEALRHALDDPRVTGELADRMGLVTATYALDCLKKILLPPEEPDDDGE